MNAPIPIRIALLLFVALSSIGAEALKLTATIPLPGVTGRFDHFAVDPAGHRLFVAALGNNTVEVIDVTNNKRITSITGVRKPQGILFLTAQNQIAVAAGGDGVLKIFSGETYKPVATIDSLDDADNIRLDSKSERIYVGYGDGALAIIDAKSLKKIGDLKTGGHPESFQLEQNGPRIFVNVPGVKELLILDRANESARKSIPLNKFRSNFPMAFDEANHRLFIGCRTPPRLLVFDTQSLKEISDTEISGDTDDLFYDPKRNRVYVSCGEGFLDVLSAAPDEPLKRIEKIPTPSGARTSFFSPVLGALYLAVPNRGSDPAEIRVFK